MNKEQQIKYKNKNLENTIINLHLFFTKNTMLPRPTKATPFFILKLSHIYKEIFFSRTIE